MSFHPIFKAYIESNGRAWSLPPHLFSKEIYFEKVFYSLICEFDRNIVEVNQNLLLEIDQVVLIGHSDSDLFLLFIYVSIFYCNAFKLHERTKTLYILGNSILSDKNHLFTQNNMMYAKAKVKSIEGNRIEEKNILHELMLKIDKNSNSYKKYVNNYAVALAELGKLNDLGQYELMILNKVSTERQESDNIFINITNCIIVGNYLRGFELIENHKKKVQITKSDGQLIDLAIKELNFLSGDLNESNYSEDSYKIFIKAYKCLLYTKIDESMKCYQWLIENTWENFVANRFIDFLPLHYELCKGNTNAAKILLEQKKEMGNEHFLDDFFYGRLNLLENNLFVANEVFERLIKNIEFYGAKNRLIFEIQFAKEMKVEDIERLTNGWKRKKEIKSNRKVLRESSTTQTVNKHLTKIIGNSLKIGQIKELIQKYAKLKVPILILGETGTGKELVARALHDEGNNPKEPFLAINCGALSDSLLQSELYGYVAGAFTGAYKEHKGIFEAAGKGTVFLDEFGEISPLLQISLLRVLESSEIRMLGSTGVKKIECRIVVATNIDLHKAVNEKKFRQDLYFRLTGFEINIPPLRERKDDIPILAEYFLNNDNIIVDRRKKLTKGLLELLTSKDWPGNIRELKNVINRLKIMNFDKELYVKEDLKFERFNDLTNSPPKEILKTDLFQENQKIKLTKNNINQNITSEDVIKIIQKESIVTRRISFIKQLFRQHKRLSRKQVVEIINFHPAVASKELQILCDEGFIVRRTPTTSPRTFYFELIENI